MWPSLQVEVSSSSGVSSNRSSSDLQRLLQPGHHPAVPSCLSLSGPATSDGQPGDAAAEQPGPAIPASPFSQPCTQDAGNGLQCSPSFLSNHGDAGRGPLACGEVTHPANRFGTLGAWPRELTLCRSYIWCPGGRVCSRTAAAITATAWRGVGNRVGLPHPGTAALLLSRTRQ